MSMYRSSTESDQRFLVADRLLRFDSKGGVFGISEELGSTEAASLLLVLLISGLWGDFLFSVLGMAFSPSFVWWGKTLFMSDNANGYFSAPL